MWVLIVAIVYSGSSAPALVAHDFGDKAACEFAREQFAKVWGEGMGGSFAATCVPKVSSP